MNQPFRLWLGLSIIWMAGILVAFMFGLFIPRIALVVAFLPPVLLLLLGWMVRWMLLRLRGGI